MSEVMIDLETLGTDHGCVVLTIGAVKFNSKTMDEPDDALHVYLDVDQQSQAGRTISEDTLAWWGQQASEVRDDAFRDDCRISVEQALDHLNEFTKGASAVWAQGPTFDMVLIESLCKQFGKPVPWKYWQVRDSRTLFGVLGDTRDKNAPLAHNAMVDCYNQAKAVQRCLAALPKQ